MSSKLIFLLLTALLLVQCSVGKSMPDAGTAAEVSEEEETKKESDAGDLSDTTSEEKSEETPLTLVLVRELTEIRDLMLNEGKKLIEDVVADVNAMEEKSESLKNKAGQMDELVSKLDKIDFKDKNKLAVNSELFRDMCDLLESFNTAATENPSAEDLIIEASLKKHGIEKMKNDIEVKYLEFTERFAVAADKVWDSLSPEEQTERKAFPELLKLFKEETDVEKISTLIDEIMEILTK